MKNRIAAAISIVVTVLCIVGYVWLVPSFVPSVEAAGKLGYAKQFDQGVQIGRSGSELNTIRTGSGAFSSGVLVVSATWVAADTKIFAQRQTVAGTSGVGIAITRTPGTSFTLTSQTAGALSTQTSDTSAVVWMAIDEPSPYPTATASSTFTPTPTP
jgi:hypothetical protein